MTMAYVRKTYGVPVGRHVLVKPTSGRFAGDEMMVTSCSHRVHVRHLFAPQVYVIHPLDLLYDTPTGWFNPMLHDTRTTP